MAWTDILYKNKSRLLAGALALGTAYFAGCTTSDDEDEDLARLTKPKAAQVDKAPESTDDTEPSPETSGSSDVPAPPSLDDEPSEEEMKAFDKPIKPSPDEKKPKPAKKKDLCKQGFYARLQTADGDDLTILGRSPSFATTRVEEGAQLTLHACAKAKLEDVVVYTRRIGSDNLRKVKVWEDINKNKLPEPLSLRTGTYFINTTAKFKEESKRENTLRLEVLTAQQFDQARQKRIMRAQKAALGTGDLGRPAEVDELSISIPYKDQPLNLKVAGAELEAISDHQGRICVQPGFNLVVSATGSDEHITYATVYGKKPGSRYGLISSGNVASDGVFKKLVERSGFYRIGIDSENGRGEERTRKLHVKASLDCEAQDPKSLEMSEKPASKRIPKGPFMMGYRD